MIDTTYNADGGTVVHEYNRQRERIQTTDQNGTVHQYLRDKRGRPIGDEVVKLGANIDGRVMAISTAFDVRDLLTTISSLGAAGDVLNQVLREYNGFRQLTTEYQEHAGAVNKATTPKVQYGFADGSANTVRPTSLTYPNGRQLAFGYGTSGGIDDNLGRIASLDWNGTPVCAYTFVGAAAFVRSDYLQPGVRYDLITGSGTNPYAGLDQFGRVIDCLWHRYSGTPADLDRFKYGYDLASNRLWRQNAVANPAPSGQYFDELYAYDGLYQLSDMQRGQLDLSGTPVIVSGTLAFHETWNLDPTGNWSAYTQDATGAGTPTLAQSRDANRVNEITEIAATVGPGWIVPRYDPAGNMIGLPQPKNPSAGYAATWDAWHRLVRLADGRRTIEQNAYDGLNRRIARGSSSSDWDVTSLDWQAFTLAEWESFTLDEWGSFVLAPETPRPILALRGGALSYRHYFYSANWQVLEERTAPAPTVAGRQFVWGLRYIDELILRDRSVGGVLNERLYALQDANWNATAICDITGTVQERYAYTAYGVPQFLDSGFNAISSSAYAWEILYCGYRYDPAVALYKVRARDLHSLLGSWLRVDPVKAETNLYRYLGNNPMVLVDPSGLRPIYFKFDAYIPARLGGARWPNGPWLPEPGGLGFYFKSDNRAAGEPGASRLYSEGWVESYDIGHLTSGRLGPTRYFVKIDSDPSYRGDWSPVGDPGFHGGNQTSAAWRVVSRKAAPSVKNVSVSDGACLSIISITAASSYPFSGALAPNIDYTVHFRFRIANPGEVHVSVKGTHDEFPNYEAIVDNGPQPLYDFETEDSGPDLRNLNTSVEFTTPSVVVFAPTGP